MDRSERTVRCPVCGRPTAWHENPHRPFCSERCRLADLAGWLSDRYVIPGDPEEAVAPPSSPNPCDEPAAPPPRENT